MALDRQPHQDLMALYQGWMDCLTAAEAARLTGNFRLPNGPTAAAAQREALRTCQRLEQKRRACAARPPRNDRSPSRWT
jgi:hypothetical protein